MAFNFLVIGAGAQGAACASILSKLEEANKIVLADINIKLANKVKDKIKSEKLSAIKIDAGNKSQVINSLKNMDVLINLAPPRYNITLMRAALDAQTHYIDTASGPNYELYSIDKMVLEQMKLDPEFEKKDLTAIISCGSTPGLSNILARYLCDTLNRVSKIKFRVGTKLVKGDVPEIIKSIAEYTEIISPSWSPEVSFLYRATQPVIYQDGIYKHLEPYSGLEEYHFPEPVGNCLNTFVDHEEPITLPKFIDKGIRYVDYKNPPDIIAWALIKLGFANNEPIEIGDCKIIPRDVLLKLLRQPVHDFLDEDIESLTSDETNIICEIIVIEAEGEDNDGAVKKKLIYKNFIPPIDIKDRIQLYNKFGTTKIQVGLPAAVGAILCAEKKVPTGVIAPEAVDPNIFMDKFERIGFPIDFEIETIR